MYNPEHFAAKDLDAAYRLVEEHPFATLVALDGAEPLVSHLPLLLDRGKDGQVRLLGHMARRNRQWEALAKSQTVLVIFQGPHTYITPRWYAQHDVPTWNYAVVHVHGGVRLIEQHQELLALLGRMTERFEAGADEPWRFSLPDDLKGKDQLKAAIVGFEIRIERLQAKFKLSQNRDAADFSGVLQGLAARTDDDSRGVLALMRERGRS